MAINTPVTATIATLAAAFATTTTAATAAAAATTTTTTTTTAAATAAATTTICYHRHSMVTMMLAIVLMAYVVARNVKVLTIRRLSQLVAVINNTSTKACNIQIHQCSMVHEPWVVFAAVLG